MTTHVYATSYHSPLGNGLSLASGEHLYVAAGATLSSGDSNGVWGTGSGHFISVYGNVVGDNMGIWIEGSGNLVRIGAGAQVQGLGAGILLEGYSQQVDNSGYIFGSFYGVSVHGIGLGGANSITNKGTIEAFGTGVMHTADATGPFDALTLVNSGTIRAIADDQYSFVSMDGVGLVDRIVNTGTMVGNINMGDGNDRIDTSKGVVLGIIELRDGKDVAFGSAAADSIDGGNGDDFIRGGAGKDTLDGGSGRDTADYSDKTAGVQVALKEGTYIGVKVGGVTEDVIFGFEQAFGGSGADSLAGDALANLLRGNGGGDTLAGGAGNDTIAGGTGKDALAGGLGLDRFVFDTSLGASNIDTITDFSHADDTMALEISIFRAIAAPWSAAQFRANASGHAASNASQHVIYDKSNGSLWYDDDGNGAHAAIQFATLSNKPADLNFTDFVTFSIV